MSTKKIGDPETEMLKANIHDQLNRLLDQLEDLEALRDELTEEEYLEEKAYTIETQEYLETTFLSNISLATEFTPQQQAIKQALAQMNANADPDGARNKGNSGANQATAANLRNKLIQLESELKSRIISQDSYNQQAGDIVLALQSVDKLNKHEMSLLGFSKSFTTLSAVDSNNGTKVLSSASTAVQQAQKQ
jgi:hypothetical protein